MYEIRKLCAKDIAPLTVIITEIGWKELKDCFSADRMKAVTGGKEGNVEAVGMQVAMEVAGVVLANYSKCEKKLFSFLSDITGEKATALMNASMADFAELIINVVTKEEFSDFFSVVSKRLS